MHRRFGARMVLAVLLTAGCDSFYAVHGHVSSCAERLPLEGVLLRLSNGRREGTTMTGADGSFSIALNEPDGDGPSTLTAAKPGFATTEHHVQHPHTAQDVCMRAGSTP